MDLYQQLVASGATHWQSDLGKRHLQMRESSFQSVRHQKDQTE